MSETKEEKKGIVEKIKTLLSAKEETTETKEVEVEAKSTEQTEDLTAIRESIVAMSEAIATLTERVDAKEDTKEEKSEVINLGEVLEVNKWSIDVDQDDFELGTVITTSYTNFDDEVISNTLKSGEYELKDKRVIQVNSDGKIVLIDGKAGEETETETEETEKEVEVEASEEKEDEPKDADKIAVLMEMMVEMKEQINAISNEPNSEPILAKKTELSETSTYAMKMEALLKERRENK